MKKLAALALLSIFLNGCATYHPTVPEDYSGSTTTLKDTAKSLDSGKADFFYLSHIDEKKIDNSVFQSLNASYGQGNFLALELLNNTVPAEEHVFTIVGETVYSMPIRALAGTVYEVKGNITFSPLPNEAYTVKGTLSETYSSVWIERISDGEIVEKIEIKGNSKLGFFDK